MQDFMEWLKQLFCKHDLEFEDVEFQFERFDYRYSLWNPIKITETGTNVFMLCNKCGYSKTIKKM